MSAAAPRRWRLLGDAHARLVFGRRVRVLARHIASMLEPGWTVLDVGCGDGQIAAAAAAELPGLEIRGIDVHERPRTAIPVTRFDGRRIPLDDGAVDAAILVDVLHHTERPAELFAEVRRVARRAVIVKDHRLGRPLARPVLRFMDWVGNRPHGVVLPYNYLSDEQWRALWRDARVEVDRCETRLGLYPAPARWLFETGLHFLARLVPAGTGAGER